MKITILQGSARKKGNTARVLTWVEKELINLGHDDDSVQQKAIEFARKIVD